MPDRPPINNVDILGESAEVIVVLDEGGGKYGEAFAYSAALVGRGEIYRAERT